MWGEFCEVYTENNEKLHTIKFYFIGKTMIKFQNCNEKICKNVENFLADDELKVFKMDVQTENESIFIRKDTVLFVKII